MKRIFFQKLWILSFGFFLSAGVCFAEDVGFKVSVDKRVVPLGSSAQLSLIFEGTQDIPAPEVPEIEGLEIRYLGPSTRLSIVNGQTSSSITHIYRIVPLKEGDFRIGGFSFEYKGKTYISNSILLKVGTGYSAQQGTSALSSSGEAAQLKDRIFLVMEAEKDKVYLNEVVSVKIKLYINQFQLRDIQYPQLSYEGFFLDKFGEPLDYKEVLDGRLYDVYEFRTSMFGIRTGDLSLGPAKIRCNFLVRKQGRRRRGSIFDDFFGGVFGGYEVHPLELFSERLDITVAALPDDGRPKGFGGAVGSFNFLLEAAPTDVKVGDPITLKIRIEGEGNFDTVAVPQFEAGDLFKVYEPEIRQEEGAKIFDYVIIPKKEAIEYIPEITFSYFDPVEESYQSIVRAPIPIQVSGTAEDADIKIVGFSSLSEEVFSEEKLGRDIIYIKELPGRLRRRGDYLYKRKGFISLQFLPLIILITFLSLHKRGQRLKADTGYARCLRAPKRAKAGILKARRLLKEEKAQEFYGAVFSALRDYIGDKFHIPSGGLTGEAACDILKNRGVDDDVLDKLSRIFSDCDTARYASSAFGRAQMADTLGLLEVVIGSL